MRNNVSRVHFLHRQLGLTPEAFNSFHVMSLLRAVDVTMRTPPLRQLPIFPHLLTQLCQLSGSLGSLGPAIKVCLTFGFLGMLRQSILAPPSVTTFDPTRHLCKGDVILAHPGHPVDSSMDQIDSGGGQDPRVAHPLHLWPSC